MFDKLRRTLIGAPRDIEDPEIFHKISLIAFLAWVGLGSDGLSSSAYGPAEAFKALALSGDFGSHTELAIFLAIATTLTVFIISMSYSQIIEHFPTGGGGYVVATKLLGAPAGLVSGSALLIDYVLTITVSIAAGADAVFAFLPNTEYVYTWNEKVHKTGLHDLKVPLEFVAIVILIVMNLRGVKESIKVLVPIFMLFVITHVIMLGAVLIKHFGDIGPKAAEVSGQIAHSYKSIGFLSLFTIFAKAFSQGAGTFTGIEAVSNGLAIMREPKVATGKRTMVYMAASLALTAGGILVAFLLCGVTVDPANPERPLNAVLLDNLAGSSRYFWWFPVLTLVAEAALLLIAAQTGFIDGPRVMANMALDSWLPHRFSSLSERLTTHHGIMLIGAASLAALFYTWGEVDTLVIMYSINVFITFSLSQLGMCRFFWSNRAKQPYWGLSLLIQGMGLTVCVFILVLVVVEKFTHGAWLTLVVTGLLIALCVQIRRYYRKVYSKVGLLPIDVNVPMLEPEKPLGKLNFNNPTAVLLVGAYGGLGIHSFLEIRRLFPNYFKQFVFVSVGVIDSGNFKGNDEVGELKEQTQKSLDQYVKLSQRFGIPATSMTMVANEPVEGAAELCTEIALRYPQAMFFAGKLVFQRETWYQRLLHNETAFAIQNRMQWLGYPMVVVPVRIWGKGNIGSGAQHAASLAAATAASELSKSGAGDKPSLKES